MVKRYTFRQTLEFSECPNLSSFNVRFSLYGGNLTCFDSIMAALRGRDPFESFLSGERFGPVHSGVICGWEKMIEQNKSPNFPALLQQSIWRRIIVEQCALINTQQLRRPAGPVLLVTRKIPREPKGRNNFTNV